MAVLHHHFGPPSNVAVTGSNVWTTTSEAGVLPFSGVTVTDANPNATDKLTIALTGGSLAGTGLTLANGVYTLAGTAAAITAQLDALVFTPNKGAIGSQATTTFTLSDMSSAYAASVSNATITVIDIDPGVLPTITGTKTGLTTTSEAAVTPFTGVVLADANSGATDVLTITLSGGGGTLLGGKGLSLSNGVYTLSGTASSITSQLDALVFVATKGVPNSQATTTFSLSAVSSAHAISAINSMTTVTDIDPAVAPTITGVKSGQTTTSEAAVKPFATVRITDLNDGAIDKLTIALAGGGGTLTGDGLSVANGVYSLSGTARRSPQS
jgi:hypothetical protein